MIGKSIFIWQTEAIYGGDAGRIAAALKSAGFESAILHSATLSTWRMPARIALVAALKNVSIRPYGGAAVYGQDPTGEGQQAAAIVVPKAASAKIPVERRRIIVASL